MYLDTCNNLKTIYLLPWYIWYHPPNAPQYVPHPKTTPPMPAHTLTPVHHLLNPPGGSGSGSGNLSTP